MSGDGDVGLDWIMTVYQQYLPGEDNYQTETCLI